MANETDSDAGTIQVLLERLNTYRLPRALAIKQRLDHGERLTDNDIDFMQRVLEDAGSVQHLGIKHPEYQSLMARLVGLYHEIMNKAVENEQTGPKG